MHVLRSLTITAAVLKLALALSLVARAQSVATTTVTGTIYSAGGAPASGTLQVSWPAFTTAGGQAIAAGRTNVAIGSDGKVSVALAPNIGASPAGLFYTAVYHLADGTTSTEYWVVPNSIETTIAQIRAKVMPAAQAVQAVSKAYVDQSIARAVSSQITPPGGTLTGPLYLAGDPAQPAEAANRHYVDAAVSRSLPLGGGVLTGAVTAPRIGAVYQADQFAGPDFGARLQACINALDAAYGGTCDARNFTGQLSMASNLNIATGNVTIYLPCSTIATAASVVVPAGTRNVSLHGCASRGTSAASGSQGGTVFLYSGNSALLQVGDPSFLADTKGFRLDNAALNTTAASAASAQAIALDRTQEISLASLYLLGNSNQTAVTLDGTGNYTGGTFEDLQITGYQTAVNGIGHTMDNAATTDWLNASTFVRLHVDCPTQNGNAMAGTTGINLQSGDGNTFTGGDIESCATALHLGSHAQNNTIVGLRNENSSSQVVADAGSSYNSWITGGTMFTGKLTDNGTRNSFLDTFHRSFNALNGDWFGSQQDTTLTNHFRLGIGTGNERGLLDRYQTDSGYRWTTGLSDASAGAQYYQILDELNNVYRLSIGQYNNGYGSTNNQTVLNAAGTGAVLLNGSNNAGTGGVVFGSGGPVSSTVATIDHSGNANFTGTLLVGGVSQSTGTMTVRNNANSEVDYYLWPGLTTSQKGSFTYKDFNGASQWYMVKDQNNNWALNSAIGGLDSFKAYQSSNSGDTYINAANATGVVRINYESGSGAAFNVYGGNSSTLYAGFSAPNAIKFPGLAAASGRNCLQIDNSGYLSNTSTPCSAASGTVSNGTTGQIAYYTANGTTVSGTSTVPLSAGGTGAANAAGALANLGALGLTGGTLSGPLTATEFNGPVNGRLTGDVTGNVKGNVSGDLTGNVSLTSGLTFADNSVQVTSQEGALSGAANDATARSAATQAESDAQAGIMNAAAAQAAANSSLNGQANDAMARTAAAQAESDAQAGITAAAAAVASAAAAQSSAGAALPANGASSTGAGTSNVVTFPGTVAAGNAVLGTQTLNTQTQAVGIPLYQTSNVIYGKGTPSPLAGSIYIAPHGLAPREYGIKIADGAVSRWGIRLGSIGNSLSASLQFCGRWWSSYCSEFKQEGSYFDIVVTGGFYRLGSYSYPFVGVNSTTFLGFNRSAGISELWSSSGYAVATGRSTQLPDGTKYAFGADTSGCFWVGGSSSCGSNAARITAAGDATFKSVTSTTPASITNTNCIAAAAVTTPCLAYNGTLTTQSGTYTVPTALTVGPSGGDFQVCHGIHVNAAGAAGTVQLQLTSTSWDNQTLNGLGVGGAVSLTSTGYSAGACTGLSLKASANVQLSWVVSGATGTPGYVDWIDILRIH